MVIDIGTDEDIIKEKHIFGKRERDIEIVVKEIDGDRDRRAQSATNLLLPVQPLPRDLILSQSNICLTPPLHSVRPSTFIFCVISGKDLCLKNRS